MAISGKFPAMTMFWLKAHAHWSEGMEIESTEDKTMRRPGVELIFAKLEPLTGNELEGYEYVGRDDGYYHYRHARDVSTQQSGAPGKAGKGAQSTQEKSNVEA
jgi:hypothetical protein